MLCRWVILNGGLVLALLAGCANPPGGLRLELRPVKEVFSPDEPVRFEAIFSATGGSVCIDRPVPGAFSIEVARLGDRDVSRTEREFVCGTGYVLLFPLFALINLGACLDEADVLGRYLVVPDGQSRSIPLQMLMQDGRLRAVDDPAPANMSWTRQPSQWPPGSYHVVARFKSQTGSGNPAPLFWSVYDQAAQAEAEFVVRDAEPASMPDVRAWVAGMLRRADAGEPFVDDAECQPVLRNKEGESGRVLPETGRFVACATNVMSEDVAAPFISAGVAAIPELIQHVDDLRPTDWYFKQRPNLSAIVQPMPQPVGLITCYLIEAILQKTSKFTSYPHLLDDPACRSFPAEDQLAALKQAAAEYTRWYRECFDERSATITCGDEKLPLVNWDYDLDFWQKYEEAAAKSQRAEDVLIGRRVVDTRTGVTGYMLMLDGGAWVSCFLTGEVRDDWCVFDWRQGQGEPAAEEIARLGRLDGALDEARKVELARGKKIAGVGRGHAIWPEFDDRSKLWLERPEYYPGMRRIHVKWFD